MWIHLIRRWELKGTALISMKAVRDGLPLENALIILSIWLELQDFLATVGKVARHVKKCYWMLSRFHVVIFGILSNFLVDCNVFYSILFYVSLYWLALWYCSSLVSWSRFKRYICVLWSCNGRQCGIHHFFVGYFVCKTTKKRVYVDFLPCYGFHQFITYFCRMRICDVI